MIAQVISMVLPVLVLILLGRYCGASGILNAERHAGLKAIIGDLLLPVVLFNAFFTADYSGRVPVVFALVFIGYGVALAVAFLLRRLVRPYDRFMPLLLVGAEGGMLGYALFSLLPGGSTGTYAIVDIGQTAFAYTVFLAVLKSLEGKRMTPAAMVKNMLTNRACIGMLLGIVLGALGVNRLLAPTAVGQVLQSVISAITAPTSALILLVVGYELRISRTIIRPVLITALLRVALMGLLLIALRFALFAIIPFDKALFLALMVQYALPALFIIPLYADLGKDSEYVSTTLSVSTLFTVLLFIGIAAYSLAGV